MPRSHLMQFYSSPATGTEALNLTLSLRQNCVKMSKIIRPWPKSKYFQRWSIYICVPIITSFLPYVFQKMPWTYKFDPFHQMKCRNVNRPWPKSNHFWRRSGYINIHFADHSFRVFSIKCRETPRAYRRTDVVSAMGTVIIVMLDDVNQNNKGFRTQDYFIFNNRKTEVYKWQRSTNKHWKHTKKPLYKDIMQWDNTMLTHKVRLIYLLLMEVH